MSWLGATQGTSGEAQHVIEVGSLAIVLHFCLIASLIALDPGALLLFMASADGKDVTGPLGGAVPGDTDISFLNPCLDSIAATNLSRVG